MRVNVDIVTLAALIAAGYVAWRWYAGGTTTQEVAVEGYSNSSLATPYNWWMGKVIDWSSWGETEARTADERSEDIAENLQRRFEGGSYGSL